MRCIVIGLGIQGRKRKKVLEACGEFVCSVDPIDEDDDSYRELLDVSLDRYDAAMVCVPPDQKIPIIEYLTANKKHMLVEKPLLGSDDQLRMIDGACADLGVVAYVAYNHRFEPMIVKLKELIDSGDLGKIYHCRMFYGNGTAEDVRNSPWRDSGNGVMDEIGSHLIDMGVYLFDDLSAPHEIVSASHFENKKYDYAIFTCDGNPSCMMEVTYLSWKNTFTIDLIGKNGSAHLDGLTKWGRSTLTIRKRQRPPGIPTEEVFAVAHEDRTWAEEYAYFKSLCEKREHPGLARDLMINKTLEAL